MADVAVPSPHTARLVTWLLAFVPSNESKKPVRDMPRGVSTELASCCSQVTVRLGLAALAAACPRSAKAVFEYSARVPGAKISGAATRSLRRSVVHQAAQVARVS